MALTHFDQAGNAHMVDVSDKAITSRVACASGVIRMSAQTLAVIADKRAKKGDVLAVAQLAGIMGAKRTSETIPLCHPLPLSKVTVELSMDAALPGVRVSAEVKTTGPTGVEMEALNAVSTACLTVYDMVKAVEKGMEITDIRLEKKSGGASGDYHR